MTLTVFGLGKMADVFADRVIYRNLIPYDTRLPPFKAVWRKVGLETGRIPRKVEATYGRVIAWYLRKAQELDRPQVPLRELVFIGDTELLDRTAFRHLKQVLELPGWAFIANEQAEVPPNKQIQEGDIVLANRWAAIADFVAWLQEQGAALDQSTVVVVDMDKTLVGAQGRNHQAVDQARVEGVAQTVANVLQERFDRAAFIAAYTTLNQPEFHPFTADNQDYVAYICLVVSAGLMPLAELVADVRAGRMTSFDQFIRWADMVMPFADNPGLGEIHQAVCAWVQREDPTPFKAFRRNEFLTTVARYGNLPDDALLAKRLAEEICLTHEVMETLRWFKARQAQIMCISDKPDEASVPTKEQMPALQPLHHTPTHVVGEPIQLP